VTALGTMSAAEIRTLGFHLVMRPTTIGDIVAAAAALLRPQAAHDLRPRR
jgi:hypothetical protein